MIRSSEPGKMRLGLWLTLFSVVVFLTLIFLSMRQVIKGLDKMHVQVQKIVAASDLYTHLIAQSYAIRGYMLYQDVPYLEEFRSWSRSNEREIEELLKIVRPARKPLVRGVLERHVKYVEMCEEEIIPRVQKGDVEGAARIAWESGAVALLREMLDATDRLREMRITDTHALVDHTVRQARRALVWGCGSGLLGLLVVLGGGTFMVRRMVMEGLVYRLMLLNITSAVAVLRRNGLVHYVNPAAENLFSLESKKVAGKPFLSVFAGRMEARGDSRALPVQESLASGNPFSAEIDYTAPDGRKLAFLVDCLPLLEEGGGATGRFSFSGTSRNSGGERRSLRIWPCGTALPSSSTTPTSPRPLSAKPDAPSRRGGVWRS
ncbi:MAG: PAS domain-containing protein [Bacillota bacterium]|nr:PAS domain-containing protein [Bacillota bacterium]